MNQTIKVEIKTEDKNYQIDANPNDNLLKLLQKSKVWIKSPCGGKGLCGKCKIKIVQGNIPPSASDIKFFTPKELDEGWRLACTSSIHGPMVIYIPDNEKSNENYDVLTTSSNNNSIEPNVNISTLIIEKDLNGYNNITEYINHQLKNDFDYTLKALKSLGNLLKVNSTSKTFNIVHNETTIFNITSKALESFGIAIDIGTTTIAFALLNSLTGEVIDHYSCVNPQQQYGYDVVSRIQYASQSDEHLSAISHVIKDCLLKGIHYFTESIQKETINQIVLAGNTTMIQLLLSIDCTSLSYAPFTMITNDVITLTYNELFSLSDIDCKIHCLPALAAYVGGDITAGILKSKMYQSEKINLLVDIGTNGEMVIGNKDKLICASTAAGPAFEGANIKYGTGAVPGAISAYNLDHGQTVIETIGNKEPIGICGTGIIDIVSVLFNQQLISDTGFLESDPSSNDGEYTIYKRGDQFLSITQKDIREIQLAKSAIRSGIEVIAEEMNCTFDDIDTVYISGGFGSKMHLNHAINIGLLPKDLESKVKPIGNSSLDGAISFMLNPKSNKAIDEIIKTASYIELSNNMKFNEHFMTFISF